ncbi:MAG TPA: DUF2950 domain-containing protein [Thermoanaerobaculia bacterium]|nr:DUF2950 domain-containing protein [Thermoanaerobaculia bacterium]
MRQQSTDRWRNGFIVCAAGLLVLLAGCSRAKPGTYATPEEAVTAFTALIGTHNNPQTDVMFGPGASEMFHSGDDEADSKAATKVKEMIAAKVAFEEVDDDTRVALFGEKGWPFPIPLVRDEGRWRFDTAAGREELLNRRIGYFELATLSSLHAYVDAQHEYASAGRDGNPPAFAQRFLSNPGKHDGLYWPAAEGEPLSPLGDLLAEAASPPDRPQQQPYQGYYYRILTSQGNSAPGGAGSYLDGSGAMARGFAAIAWPAKYGNSGVMTFLVSQRGVVFQKDLGPQTGEVAPKIQIFDPDSSWAPTGDTLAEVEGVETELASLEHID